MTLTVQTLESTEVTTNDVVQRGWRTQVLLPILAAGFALAVIVAVNVGGHQEVGEVAYVGPTSAAGQPPLPTGVSNSGFDSTTSLANYDASAVATVVDNILVFDPGDHPTKLSPGFELRALSTDGTKAALVQVAADSASSEVLVANRDGEEPHRFEFDRLVEPEAFSTDGQTLFVIDHGASHAPGTYRVRPLNLATGVMGQMLGPTKVPLEEDMNGIGGRQVWGLGDDRLYTLYTRQDSHAHTHSDGGEAAARGFVHVLDLREEWAFCLDLPPTFGSGSLDVTALAVTETTIAVLDLNAGTSGQIAYASTTSLTVTDVVELPVPFLQAYKRMAVDAVLPLDAVHLALAGGAVAMGIGDQVAWFDAKTLTPLESGPSVLPAPLLGLTSGPSQILAWPQNGLEPVVLTRPI